MLTLTLEFNNYANTKVDCDNPYFTIVLAKNSEKNYKLKKKMLGKSEFIDRFIKNTDGTNILYITQKWIDPQDFEEVLNLFHGMPIVIQDYSHLYRIYKILNYLRIDEVIEQVHEFIKSNPETVLLGVQIAELYSVQSLSEYYYGFLHENGFLGIFNNTYNLDLIRRQLKLSTEQPPLNYLLLQESVFKKLIELHNVFCKNGMNERKHISQFQIAQRIKEYCLVRPHNDNIKLKELFQDCIHKNQLTPLEYNKLMEEFQEESRQLQTASVSMVCASETHQLDQNSFDEQQENLLTSIVEAMEEKVQLELERPIFMDVQFNIQPLLGMEKLSFVFTTSKSRFGFYCSLKIENGDFKEDPELEIFNLSVQKKLNTRLKVNRIKFENGVNINNRIIIEGKKGVSRYDEDVFKSNTINFSGERVFEVLAFEVLRYKINPFQ